jgi:signal transduction histidine kinase
MSKLSLNLVSLCEKPFNPLVEIGDILRMFEREAFTKGIHLTFSLGEGYRKLGVAWVLADPTRFAQVLVNLISNALRFTENAPTRAVEVTLDASEQVPNLIHRLKETKDIYHHTSSAHRENPLFLISSIRDSGVGLTLMEQSTLFQKFSQASPKTYSQYGGSGLGLFISKALVEVQGGRISLESERNRGTTVTFYIQCSPTTAPEPPPREDTRSLRRAIDLVVTPSRTLNVLIVEDNLVR